MKITITLMAALAISTASCGSTAVGTGNNSSSGTANTAAKPAANTNTSGASTTAATAPAGNLPAEVKVGNDVYKLVPSTDAKLNPGVLEKYFKGLTGDKVRMEFYSNGNKQSPVMVGTYPSEAAAKEAMESIDADKDDVIWTKGNLLIVTDNAEFANKL